MKLSFQGRWNSQLGSQTTREVSFKGSWNSEVESDWDQTMKCQRIWQTKMVVSLCFRNEANLVPVMNDLL